MTDKNKEAWYLERLRSHWKRFPVGRLIPSESPDYLVIGDEKKVGIEFTEFILPPEPGAAHTREVESLRRQIVLKSLQRHRDMGGAALLIDIEFDDRVRLTKRDIDVTAQLIAERVRANRFEEVDTPSWYQQVTGDLPRGVAAICGGRYRQAEDWASGAGGWVREGTPEHIQAVIHKKARLYPAYRAKCDLVVLTIVFSAFDDPSTEIPAGVLEHCYESPFDECVALFIDVPSAIELRRSEPSNA